MSLMSGAPIIPVGIQASYKPFTKVKINIGKEMDLSKFKDMKNDKETLNSLSYDLMNEMIRLTNENV